MLHKWQRDKKEHDYDHETYGKSIQKALLKLAMLDWLDLFVILLSLLILKKVDFLFKTAGWVRFFYTNRNLNPTIQPTYKKNSQTCTVQKKKGVFGAIPRRNYM